MTSITIITLLKLVNWLMSLCDVNSAIAKTYLNNHLYVKVLTPEQRVDIELDKYAASLV